MTVSSGKGSIHPVANRKKLRYSLFRDRWLILLSVPVLAYYIIFHYLPMYGVLIAFKDYSPSLGIWNSPWVGFQWLERFFSSPFFWKLMRNTLLISLYALLWGFPFPIIFALLLNEMRTGVYKKIVQSVSYFPYFISLVVMVGILDNMLNPINGVVNKFVTLMGGEPQAFMTDAKWYRTVYVASNVWQNFGFTSIIYISALATVDPTLYESSRIDGASRWQDIIYITLPSILPTIIMMLILRMGSLMSVGYEKAYLMYKSTNAEVSDIISLYVYRKGISNFEFSQATAIDLFNSVINIILLSSTNALSRKLGDTSLW